VLSGSLKKALFLILVLVILFSTRIFCFCAEPPRIAVEDLSGNKYFPRVKEALQNAKKSIYMAMYFVNFDPKDKKSAVSQLVEELVNARKRGVKVKVILDQNMDFPVWEGGAGVWQKQEKNDPFFVYLKKEGVDACYDDIFTVTHSKLIIIDEETVILGSANWSESSLRRNWESSCLINSKELAKQFLADFSNIAIDSQASILDEERKPPIRLSQAFLTDPTLASRMLRDRDESAFDFYLLLLRIFDGNREGSIVIDYKFLIPASGLDKRLKYASAVDELKQALRRFEEKYRLIIRKKKFFQKTTVILLNYPDKTPYSSPQEKYYAIPDEYWQYNWHTNLSFPEKYCYLISLCKGGSSRGRLWTAYLTGLSKEFNISTNTLWRGMSGLRKLNIIDMEYSDYNLEEGVVERDPIHFRLFGLYSPEALSKQKARLAKLYGPQRFKQAAEYAEIVYKGNNIQVIEDIIKKMDEYGIEQVSRAFKIVSEKSAGNPLRSYKYVIGILQGEAEKAGH